MMEYIYAGMWFLVGLILIFRFGRENRIMYAAGGFFLIMGGWWVANTMTSIDLFTGVWGWVFRAIAAAALILLCAAYYKDRKRQIAEGQDKDEHP